LGAGTIGTHHPAAIAIEARAPVFDRKKLARLNPTLVTTARLFPLSAAFGLEPIFNLKLGVAAAYRVQVTLTHIKTGKILPPRAIAQLYDEDLVAIDIATARYVALALEEPVVYGQSPILMPTSFRTMGSRHSRALVVEALAADPARIRGSVLVELVEVHRGTPPSRLTEVVAGVHALSRGVFVRVPPGAPPTALERSNRLQGAILDTTEMRGDARITHEMMNFADQLRGRLSALMAVGLPNSELFAMAQVAGLSHAGIRAVAARRDSQAA
jgi:hypothetical protein